MEITDNTVTFLWASEETGFRHIYLVTSSLSAETLNGCNDASTVPSSSNAYDSSQRLKFHGSANTCDGHGDITDAPTLYPRIINKVRNKY